MKKKQILLMICAAAMLLCACGGPAEENNMVITLSDTGIAVDDRAISVSQETQVPENTPVYVTRKIETHPDVKEEYSGTENTVVHITGAGTYTVSGTAANTQISVEAGENDAVELVLDGADITCMTAPAIIVKSAKDDEKAGESGVKIRLEDGSVNKITGSHIARINDDDIKYDGAISSDVSLAIDGTGALELYSDNEGVECKMHLTVNDGKITVKSANDALNASNDGVSVITVNGGDIFCDISEDGEEGDGIDSNGTIVINGGTVISYANAASADSGLDADGGTTINGGIVLAAGNMQDRINADSKQAFMQLTFKEKQQPETQTVITDENGNPIAAFAIPSTYTSVQLSVPELKLGKYKVYTGGVLVADKKNGLCVNLTSYSPGTLMQHGGAMGGGMGMPPQGGEPPKMPEGMEPGERPEPPKDMGNRERPEMHRDGERPGGGMSMALSDIFELTAENKMFMNVTAAE